MAELDLAAHAERSRKGPCFVFAYISGHPDYEHELVYAGRISAEKRHHVVVKPDYVCLP